MILIWSKDIADCINYLKICHAWRDYKFRLILKFIWNFDENYMILVKN